MARRLRDRPLMVRLFRHYVPGLVLAVLAADAAVIVAAIGLVSWMNDWIGERPVWAKAAALTATVIFLFYLADLYKVPRLSTPRDVAARLAVALATSAILSAAVGFALPPLRFGRLAFFQIFTLLSGGLVIWRTAWMRIHSIDRLRHRVLVLGVSSAARRIVELQDSGASPFVVVGFLDDDPGAHEALPDGYDLLGKTRDIVNLVEELLPDLVVVALRDMRGAFPVNDLLECRLRGIPVEDWPTFYEKQTGKVLVTGMRPSWLIFSDGFVKTHLTQAVKRAVDIVLAFAGLVLTLPVMAMVAAAIKLDSRGPVLFRQERVGRYGTMFVLKKFRSMRQDAERMSGPVWATADDPRITRVGRWLRKTRLDELPQLVNVLLGEMSFIGPRPERPEFVRTLHRHIPFYMERLTVRPGLTGWAQVRHHYAASVDDALEKLQYDLYYVKNVSPFLDVLILLNTIQVVLFGRGSR